MRIADHDERVHYSVKKAENWRVVLDVANRNAHLSTKRVPFERARVAVQLQLAAREKGRAACDGNAGCNLENELALSVVGAGVSTNEDNGDDEEEEE